jgi:homoserine kinase type II
MSVLPHLTESALRRVLKPFRLGELLCARGVNAQTVNRFYDLSTTRGRYILRIAKNRTSSDARFEKTLLEHLMQRGLAVPRLMAAGRRDCVVSLRAGQMMSVFAYMPGRQVAAFEVGRAHAAQVGQFLADLHRASRGLGRRRADRFDRAHLHTLLRRCAVRAQAPEQLRAVAWLRRELERLAWPQGLPQGTLHGDLSIDHVRFEHGTLCGVLDFACAATGPWAWDIALALVDWAFSKDTLCLERLQALVSGYAGRRQLKPEERAALFTLSRLAALRYAIARLHDFELPCAPAVDGPYRDYRHFVARYRALVKLGPTRFEAAC